jgi:RNA polymerase sigma-70 factor (ECF subfamily)
MPPATAATVVPVSNWEEDVHLLERWRAGDKTAGRELYARHIDVVIRFLRNKVPDRLEDFVNETFTLALERAQAGKIRDAKAFRSFILGVANYTVISHNRRLWRESEFDPERHTTADMSPGPFSIVVQKEEQRVLLKALRRIPFESQVLLELVYFENLDHHAVADIVEIDYQKVRRKLHAARQKIKEVIMTFEESPELLTSTMGDIEGWAVGVREQFFGARRTDG